MERPDRQLRLQNAAVKLFKDGKHFPTRVDLELHKKALLVQPLQHDLDPLKASLKEVTVTENGVASRQWRLVFKELNEDTHTFMLAVDSAVQSYRTRSVSMSAFPVNTLNAPKERERSSYPPAAVPTKKRPLPLVTTPSSNKTPKTGSTPARSSSSAAAAPSSTSKTPQPQERHSRPESGSRKESPLQRLEKSLKGPSMPELDMAPVGQGKRPLATVTTPIASKSAKREQRTYSSSFRHASPARGTIAALFSRARPAHTNWVASPARRLEMSTNRYAPLELDHSPVKEKDDNENEDESRLLFDEVQLEGFKNLGNTCYVNAVLQGVLSLSRFRNDLLSSYWQQKMDAGSADRPSCFKALTQLATLLQTENHGILDAQSLKDSVEAYSQRFQGNLQQDAHEFCGDLLNALHDELFATFTRRAKEAAAERDDDDEEADGIKIDDEEESHKNAGRYLPTVRRLHATISTTLECVSCGSSRDKLEDFLDLSVDFPVDKPATWRARVADLLNEYFRDDERDLRCEKCDGTRVRVKYAFGSVPDYLIVHLKRFRPAATGYVKVTDSIDLASSQVLDVSQWCTDETALPQLDQSLGEAGLAASRSKKTEWGCPRCTLLNSLSRSDCDACQQERPPLDSFGNPIPAQLSELNGRQYRLKAVVRHLGSFAFAGHYVCDVEQSEGWVRYDDSTARKLQEGEVLKDGSTPYILFYERVY